MKNLTTTILLFQFVSVFSQCGYFFNTTNSQYQDLASGQIINNGNIWTQQSAYNLPLGFNFPLTAGRYTTNIQVEAGSIILDPLTGANHKLLLYHWPFGGNLLTDNGIGTSTSQSPITYLVSGPPGNQIGKLEFNNAGFEYDHANYCSGFLPIGNDYVNFQFWFFESTGRIEVHFGASNVANPISYNCGAATPGPFIKLIVDNTLLNIHTNFNAPLDTCLSNQGIVYGIPMNGNTPNNGMVYVFDPDLNYFSSLNFYSTFNNLTIFPIPAEDQLFISNWNNNSNAYSIVDLFGNIIKTGYINKNIDVKYLLPGYYVFISENIRRPFIKK